jgi:hypothetical protein
MQVLDTAVHTAPEDDVIEFLAHDESACETPANTKIGGAHD